MGAVPNRMVGTVPNYSVLSQHMILSHCEFAAALMARGRETPDALAFACGGERLSYGRLLDEASRLAAGLAAQGLMARDRVALVLPAGLEFVRGFAAVALAGAVPFAIPPEISPAIAMARAARGRPRLALTSAGARAPLALAAEDSSIPVLALEELALPFDPALPPLTLPEIEPEDPAVLQLTSGTTGEPRFAVLSHRALSAWRQQAAGPLLAAPGDVLAGWAPPWHVMGLVRFVILPVICGVETHLVPPAVRTLGTWLETAARVRATFTAASDFALRTAVRLVGRRELDLGALRCVVSGGEAVRASSIRAFEERFDLAGIVRPGYGLAEATLTVTWVRPGETLAIDPAGNVSCGRPLPGVALRIVDERGCELAPGEPGEIRVQSASLFSGYFDGAPGDTRVLADGWLATGDWGRLGPDGELFVLGRRRNLLKHGGATYAPRELEEAAERVGGVAAAAALTLARTDLQGSVLVVVVEASHPLERQPEDLARDVASAIRRAIGLLPGEVLIVGSGTLPRTESGKLRHAELRRALATSALAPHRVLVGRLDGWVDG